jgi:hypothetical protein
MSFKDLNLSETDFELLNPRCSALTSRSNTLQLRSLLTGCIYTYTECEGLRCGLLSCI